jgi:protein disulfide-isomerase A6
LIQWYILQISFDFVPSLYCDLSLGRGSTSPIKGAALPEINPTEPWDGKDGELPPEEDIDLSDIDLDDIDNKDEL